jgi:hypothetical protein
MKKYVIVGGYITSAHDKTPHYIDAPKLIDLYKINEQECYKFETRSKMERENYEKYSKYYENLLTLFPQYDGNYELPEPEESDVSL